LGELVFIGLGLHDERGLSLRGQAEAKSCESLFAGLYTSLMPGLNVENLERMLGKTIQVLSRSDVEEKAESTILSQAKDRKVGFLVPGDPMIATTHVDLRLRAHKTGIKTKIIHAASVASAVAAVSGLQSYKFGRTVTIPAQREGQFPESIYTAIKNNLSIGLHSLVLLEIDMENKRHISIPLALTQLVHYSQQQSDKAITPGTLAVGVARVESPDMKIKAGTIEELTNFDFGEPPYALVIPGRLHFMEEEALHAFCAARKELFRH
jgi:diphthine synthase